MDSMENGDDDMISTLVTSGSNQCARSFTLQAISESISFLSSGSQMVSRATVRLLGLSLLLSHSWSMAVSGLASRAVGGHDRVARRIVELAGRGQPGRRLEFAQRRGQGVARRAVGLAVVEAEVAQAL